MYTSNGIFQNHQLFPWQSTAYIILQDKRAVRRCKIKLTKKMLPIQTYHSGLLAKEAIGSMLIVDFYPDHVIDVVV